MKFTGFWEATAPGLDEVAVTLSYVTADELLERLRVRLADVPVGTHIRVDLISWDGPE